MNDNKIFRVDMSNEASASLIIIAPDVEEAKRIAENNQPYASGFDSYEFSDDWVIDNVNEAPDADPSSEMNIEQEYDLDDDE